MNNRILQNFKATFRKRYIMPEESKKIMAASNNKKLIYLQMFLIPFCLILTIVTIILKHDNLVPYNFILLNYITMIVCGLISLGGCHYVKSHPKLSTTAQMSPIHFTFTYMYILLGLLFFHGNSVFNSFIIFASISIITPLFFDIEPIVFIILELSVTSSITHIVYPIVGAAPAVDMHIFALLTMILSFNKWKTAKKDYQYRRTQKEYKERMDKELSLASVVQTSFFRHEEVLYDDWTIVYYTKAMSGVSGDFFDIYNNNHKLEGLGIFDVSGHGIASGLVTMLVKNIIINEFQKGKNDKLKTVIDRINVRYLNEKGNIENYLTGILCRIKDNTVEFVNAGHSMPILFKEDEEHCVEIKNDNGEGAFGAIGLIGMPNNFVEHSVTMETGDELILFTDGITDTTNETREAFGRDRLIRSINRNADRPLSTQINCIVSDVTNYAHGRPLEDDITLIILKKK